MFLAIGLLLGLIVGFIGTNRLNSSPIAPASSSAPASSDTDANTALPPNHPPIGDQGPRGSGAPEVMATIEKAKSNPQDYEAQMTAADLYYQIQRFDDAALLYETAAKLKPAEIEPMIKAGNAYFDGEKYEQAERWYTQALAKDDKNIEVRTDLGLTFFLREPRDVARAIKEYQRALVIDPEHEVTLQNLAVAYSESGDRNNFLATLEKLRQVNPKNPVVTRSDAQ